MDHEYLHHLRENVTATLTEFALKIVATLFFLVVGRFVIRLCVRGVHAAFAKRTTDPTIPRYLGSFASVALNILLIVSLLGYFGVQTATFAALFASAGVAIGMAWSGLLAHFAAGVFLVVLRPFKVGDTVTIGGVTGTVREIGLFATIIDTADNVQTTIVNNKIWSDNIANFSTNSYRRVDLKVQLSGSADVKAVTELLAAKLAAVPNVLAQPKPDIEILEMNLVGPVLAVRPYTHSDHYWQVYFDVNKILKNDLSEFPAPVSAHTVNLRQVTG